MFVYYMNEMPYGYRLQIYPDLNKEKMTELFLV
jgi:hypothetical protein